MVLDQSTVESNHASFIARAVVNETVYCLANDRGIANSVSNAKEKFEVLMFWSDEDYAVRSMKALDESLQPQEIKLFDFLYTWLPEMRGKNILAGTNWNSDLVGVEIDPFQLHGELEKEMGKELVEKYEQKFNELKKNA